MKDLWLVASYTFKDLVKRKSFIVSNIIILAMVIIGFNIPNILKSFVDVNVTEEATKIVVLDTQIGRAHV